MPLQFPLAANAREALDAERGARTIAEARELAHKGVSEIVLLGQNVNAWHGAAPAHDSRGGEWGLGDLIRHVAKIGGVERIRYMTSHPRDMTADLIAAHGDVEKLSPFLHLPVQSGSDRILAAMKRGYTALEYKSIIRKMRAVRPDLTLSSDFIVGFPGETDADFEKLLKMIRELEFDNSFCFIFSPRPGTPAANLADDTPYETKLKRLQILLALVEEQANQISQKMSGNTERVLIEGLAKDGINLQGRAENNRVVHFTVPDQEIESLIGQMVDIRITEVLNYTLRGELVEVHAN